MSSSDSPQRTGARVFACVEPLLATESSAVADASDAMGLASGLQRQHRRRQPTMLALLLVLLPAPLQICVHERLDVTVEHAIDVAHFEIGA